MTLRSAALYLLTLCGLALASPAATPPDQFFDSDGVRIRFVDLGRGEPIVLIHGFTMSIESWNRGDILQSLARDYRVVAMDCRGHGRSDKPHTSEQYGEHLARDVLRLMDYLGIVKAHVAGYSMGAGITAYLLGNHPERFITATLGGSPPRVWNDLEEQRMRDLSARMEERDRTSQNTNGQDYKALAALPLTMRRLVVGNDVLRATQVPMLAIVGSEDRGWKGLAALKVAIPSLRLVVVDGATHTGEKGAVARPEFLTALHEFITSHPRVH